MRLVSVWGTVCPSFIQTSVLVLKKTDGILFCVWGTIVLKLTSCTRVDTLYLGGYGTAGPRVLQMWGCATGKGSRHHLMSPDQRLRQSDSPRVVPGIFHWQHPPASQKQHSLHTPLHTTTFNEQLDRFFIPFISPHFFLMRGINSTQRKNHWMMGRCWIQCKPLETAHVWSRNLIL